MANDHDFACCFFKLILLVLLIRSTKKLPSDDESTNTALRELEFTSYRHFSEAVQTRVTFGLTTRWRHVGSLSKVVGYYGARISRYANSDSTFQLIRVVISGDVSENPGPTVNKPKCQQCFRTIARNHRIIICSSCDSTYHIKCGGVTPKQHKTITTSDQTWNCLHCAQSTTTLSNDALTKLPFSHTTDESFSSLLGSNHEDAIGIWLLTWRLTQMICIIWQTSSMPPQKIFVLVIWISVACVIKLMNLDWYKTYAASTS